MKITKLVGVTLLALALSFSAQGGTNQTTSLFTGNELSATVAFNYADVKNSEFSPVLGVTYYLTRNLGLSGSTTLNMGDGGVFNNADLLVVGRLPVLKVLAPYVGVGTRLDTTRDETWSPLVSVGVETRINRNWGLFASASHDFAGNNGNLGEWAVKVGLSLRLW